MGDQLPVPAGGGSLSVPATTSSGGEVGDLSLDRGGLPAGARTSAPATGEALAMRRQIAAALNLRTGIDDRQVQQVREIMLRGRLAQDQRDKVAAVESLRAEWGSSYGQRVDLIHGWFDTLPAELAEELRDARDTSGTAICNKPAVLRAMASAADNLIRRLMDAPMSGSEGSPADERRMAEIEGLMRAPSGSIEYRRYYDDPKVQQEYRDLIDRRNQRATGGST